MKKVTSTFLIYPTRLGITTTSTSSSEKDLRIDILLLLVAFIVTAGCSSDHSRDVSPGDVDENATDTMVNDVSIDKAALQNDLSRIEVVLPAALVRRSDQRDERGMYMPPWSKQEFDFGIARSRIEVGDSLTIVPLTRVLAAKNYKINEVRERLGCTEEKEWLVDDIQVKEAAYLNYRPESEGFSAVSVYPAVEYARLVPPEASTLPSLISASTVKAAVDVTADNQPNIVYTEFCCNEPNRSPLDESFECLTCTKIYLNRGGEWITLHATQPC